MKEKKVLNISYLWLIFSCTLLGYIIYKDTVNSEIENYYFKYYLISISLVLFSLFSFSMKKKMKKVKQNLSWGDYKKLQLNK